MLTQGRDPNWLRFLNRHLGWLAIPNIAIIFITLQALGFLMIMTDPVWIERLALIPGLVLRGQLWRLITFLAIPVSGSLIWMIFALWFLYFVINAIEAEWGEFKTTFYVLISILLTIVFSFAFGYPVAQVTDFTSTLFLAAAALFPNYEIQVYLVIPVKMKYLGWLALGFLGWRFAQSDWMGRLLLLTIYSNYLIFFGPTLISRIKDWQRRRAYRARLR